MHFITCSGAIKLVIVGIHVTFAAASTTIVSLPTDLSASFYLIAYFTLLQTYASLNSAIPGHWSWTTTTHIFTIALPTPRHPLPL